MQNKYTIVLSALFAVVFAIMIFTTIKHRKVCLRSAAQSSGTHGVMQWFWVLVPLAILAFINFSLISAGPVDHSSAKTPQHLQR